MRCVGVNMSSKLTLTNEMFSFSAFHLIISDIYHLTDSFFSLSPLGFFKLQRSFEVLKENRRIVSLYLPSTTFFPSMSVKYVQRKMMRQQRIPLEKTFPRRKLRKNECLKKFV